MSVKPWDLLRPSQPRIDGSERMEICRSCEFFIKRTEQCRKCGCFMKAKTTLKKAKCPVGKW